MPSVRTRQRTVVSLRTEHLVHLAIEGRQAAPHETGGILMGYRDTSNPHRLVITDVVGPGPKAVHTPHSFEPDWEWQQQRVAEIYRASDGQTTYLGDWHTHPTGTPFPSRLDRKAAQTIATAPDACLPNPTFLIVALSNRDAVPAAWHWKARHFRRCLLGFR